MKKHNCENCKYCKEIEEENGGAFCNYIGVWVTWSKKDRPCQNCILKDEDKNGKI